MTFLSFSSSHFSSSSSLPDNPYPSMKDDVQKPHQPKMIVIEYNGKQQNMLRPPTLQNLRSLAIWTFGINIITPLENIQFSYHHLNGNDCIVENELDWSNLARQNRNSLFMLDIVSFLLPLLLFSSPSLPPPLFSCSLIVWLVWPSDVKVATSLVKLYFPYFRGSRTVKLRGNLEEQKGRRSWERPREEEERLSATNNFNVYSSLTCSFFS